MRNVRILVAYDGARFYGWQRQDGFQSVQEALEDGLGSLLSARVTVRGSGRTDTGVHALGQVANFHVDTRLDDERLLHALNAHLEEGVVVRALETCRDDFHAQHDARGKRYGYLVATAPFRPPFARTGAHWLREELDYAAMQEAARRMLGERDFRAFASAGSPRKTTVRHVRAVRLVVRRRGFGVVVEGNGFLYNMVRTMVGTLLEVGRGKLAPEDIEGILEGGDRAGAGPTAPAEGLYLVRVLYGEPVFRGKS